MSYFNKSQEEEYQVRGCIKLNNDAIFEDTEVELTKDVRSNNAEIVSNKQLSIKKNTVYNVIKTLSAIVFPLITFPYISRVIHAENVGKINFSNSIVSYIALIASLGISTYAVRECSRVRKDKENLSETASQIMSINVITTVIAYTILAIMLFFWRSLSGYELLIIIQSISIVFTTFGAEWLNSAMEDFRYITLRTFAFQLISLVCMFIFIHKPENYMVYAVISVLSTSGANMLNIFYRRRYCNVTFTMRIDWKKHLPPILWMFAMTLSSMIFTSVDTTMLGIMRNDIEVGWYSTSVKIYSMVNQVVASICWVVMPQLSYNFRITNYEEINKLLKYALTFITTMGLPSLIGLYVLAPEIIMIVGGKEYLSAVPSLRILTFALGASFFGGFIFNNIFIPSGREKACLCITIIQAVSNLIANFFLIPIWGLNAAAATTLGGQVLGLIIGMFLTDKEIKIDGKWQIVKAPLVGSVLMGIYIMVIKYFASNLWIVISLSVIGGMLIYFSISILMKNEFVQSFLISFKLRIGSYSRPAGD